MWWLFVDPEDYGKVLVVSLLLILIFFGFYYCSHKDECEKPIDTEKVITYDTISKNDSVLVLKEKYIKKSKNVEIYDTVSKNNGIIVLKIKK